MSHPSKLSTAVLTTILLFAGTSASAHQTGNERRTPEQCRALKQKQLIDNCLACVNASGKQHFHPEYPVTERCRPNDGKP